MSSIPVHTTYVTWTIAELVDATSPNPLGNKKVTIPEFQRRLVWTRKKREGLIRSIKLGFPFGSLLLYKDNDGSETIESYKLIDGLQRTQTLKQYTNYPNSSFSKTDITDEFIDLISREINPFSDLDCLANRNKEKIRSCILEWVWESRGFTETVGWGINALTDVLLLEMLELEDETYELFIARKSLLNPDSAYSQALQKFLHSIQNETDIGTVEVPVIIFSGPSKHMAEVFVLLNREGIKLNRYEIYAAEWLDNRYRIENKKIISSIWLKYDELAKEGFDLDFVDLEAGKEAAFDREFTLFEYLFGLGQLLSEEYPLFFKPVKVDQPSPFGFNLMSACIRKSVSEKDVRQLPERIHGIDLSKLEKCLLESIEFVSGILKPMLEAQRNGQRKTPYFHADLLIVTQIATAFRVRYNINDLSENEGWLAKRDTLAKHLPMYFLIDILQGNWRGSGDGKLAEILNSEAYLKSPPSKQEWIQILNVWYRNHVNTRLHAQSYIKDDFSEYLLLRYIMVRKLEKEDLLHVQHIIPITQLLAPPSHYHEFPGPINSIGNLALVPASDFTDFQDRTFVDFLKRQRGIGALGLGQYHDELREQGSLLVCNIDILPSELTQFDFEDFLAKRFRLLREQFLRVWREHIPPDPQT